MHHTAEFGNPTVMAWIIKKWKDEGVELDVNAPNHEGYAPLFHCCLKGYLGAEAMSGKAPQTKMQRLECCKLLYNEGADVNFQAAVTLMTPLHWAAYNDDVATVQYLLTLPAIKIVPNADDVTPVDIAGHCNYEMIVYIFVKYLERKLYAEIAESRNKGMGA